MKNFTLDDLLKPRTVIQITDSEDSDHGNLFVYRGRHDGHFVLDEIGVQRNPVLVKELASYRELFQVRSVPKPNNTSPNGDYLMVLQDIADNQHHILAAMELGLDISYSKPGGEIRDSDVVRAEGLDRWYDIQSSGFAFSETLSGEDIFHHVRYGLTQNGIHVRSGIQLWYVDKAYELGLAEKDLRFRTSRWPSNELVFDAERMQEVQADLLEKGLDVPELTSALGTRMNDYDLLGALNYTMNVMFVAPTSDERPGHWMYFNSLSDAQAYVNGVRAEMPVVNIEDKK